MSPRRGCAPECCGATDGGRRSDQPARPPMGAVRLCDQAAHTTHLPASLRCRSRMTFASCMLRVEGCMISEWVSTVCTASCAPTGNRRHVIRAVVRAAGTRQPPCAHLHTHTRTHALRAPYSGRRVFRGVEASQYRSRPTHRATPRWRGGVHVIPWPLPCAPFSNSACYLAHHPGCDAAAGFLHASASQVVQTGPYTRARSARWLASAASGVRSSAGQAACCTAGKTDTGSPACGDNELPPFGKQPAG
jgi:hypothetical protein